MGSVCFTGHRKIYFKDKMRLSDDLDAVIKKLAEEGFCDFYCGGALGFDTMCADAVLRIRKSRGDIRLNLVLPCSNEQQTKKWQYDDKHAFYSILMLSDSVQYIGEEYTNDCMKKRNARMIELCDCCVCYYNADDYRSGTGQTVRMAQKKGCRIINLFEARNVGI